MTLQYFFECAIFIPVIRGLVARGKTSHWCRNNPEVRLRLSQRHTNEPVFYYLVKTLRRLGVGNTAIQALFPA